MDVKRLSFQDVFTLGRIIKKAGAEATAGLALANGSDIAAGLAVAMSFPAAEPEVYKLLASVTDLSVDEVAALGPVQVIEIIEQIVDQEDLEALFSSAQRLMGKVKDKLPKSSIESATVTDIAPETYGGTDPE